jgi:hypothetical protein
MLQYHSSVQDTLNDITSRCAGLSPNEQQRDPVTTLGMYGLPPSLRRACFAVLSDFFHSGALQCLLRLQQQGGLEDPFAAGPLRSVTQDAVFSAVLDACADELEHSPLVGTGGDPSMDQDTESNALYCIASLLSACRTEGHAACQPRFADADRLAALTLQSRFKGSTSALCRWGHQHLFQRLFCCRGNSHAALKVNCALAVALLGALSPAELFGASAPLVEGPGRAAKFPALVAFVREVSWILPRVDDAQEKTTLLFHAALIIDRLGAAEPLWDWYVAAEESVAAPQRRATMFCAEWMVKVAVECGKMCRESPRDCRGELHFASRWWHGNVVQRLHGAVPPAELLPPLTRTQRTSLHHLARAAHD